MKSLVRKIRVALTPRGSLLKTRLSNGAVVYGRNRSGFGGRGIYIYRDSIEPEFQQLHQFLDASGVFADVGANTGIYTLKAARHFNNRGVVLALEPFPEVLATLSHSVRMNGFTNVRLRNFCAAERTGCATLWMNSGKPNSFSLLKRDEKALGLSVLAVALDDLWAWEGLDRLDYLKIDAEGAEQQVLSGARNILRKYRPIIQVEAGGPEVALNAGEYSAFRAPGSPNIVYIPNENSRIGLPGQLGWSRGT